MTSAQKQALRVLESLFEDISDAAEDQVDLTFGCEELEELAPDLEFALQTIKETFGIENRPAAQG